MTLITGSPVAFVTVPVSTPPFIILALTELPGR